MGEIVSVPVEPMFLPPKHIEIAEFLKTTYPPVSDILTPILQERGALMIHGATGCGKTQFVAGLSAAIASGGQFLNYKCHEPKSVVFCDFECQAATLQKRLADALLAVSQQPEQPFRVVTPDLSFPMRMPDLTHDEGRQALGKVIEGYDVVVIDNISTSFRSLNEGDPTHWQMLENWILQLRGAGQSLIVIQHEGKKSENGARGHSKQYDVFDNVLQLKRSADEVPNALRFDVVSRKSRHHVSPKKFGAQMEVIESKPVWSVVDLDFTNLEMAAELFDSGMSAREVAIELDISTATAYRYKGKTKR
jgi:hypothetical protein